MAIPLTLILPALIPVVADGFRAIFNRVTNGAGIRPANTTEAIQLMQAEAAKMKAMAELDTPAGPISPWVANFRASSRYFAAFVCILGGWSMAAAAALWPDQVPVALADRGMDTADAGFSFLFGDRMYAYLRRK